MSDIQNKIINPSAFYYESDFINNTTFLNSIYPLDLAIEKNFADMLFYGDLSRIIYASNDYCFKRRSEMSDEGLLNIPFMNYYLTGVSLDTDRKLFKNANQVSAMISLDNYDTDLGYGLKLIPLHLSYTGTVWFSQDKDLQYASSKLFFQSSNETIFYSYINAGKDSLGEDNLLKNPAFVKYNLDFKPTYEENDWLETNNITSIAVDMEIDTVAVFPDTNILITPQGNPNTLGIANEIILNFLSTKGTLLKNEDLLNTSPQELITEYFYTGN